MREDPRFVRSRTLLAGTLHRLVRTVPLAEISVSALCQEAGVHRTTFYRHAGSVRELAITTFAADIGELTTVTIAPDAESPHEAARRYRDSLRDVLTFVAADRGLYRALFGSDAHDSLAGALGAVMRPQARKAVQVFRRQGVAGAPTSDHAGEEAAAFIAGAFVGVLEAWVDSQETDAEAAADRISTLMPGWWPNPRAGRPTNLGR